MLRYIASPLLLSLALLLLVQTTSADQNRKISFARDVRPILSSKCFYCHGPDATHRKARLRLDTAESAIKQRKVIRPKHSGRSELYYRLISDDESDQMPPPEAKKSLTKEEIQTIKLWIDQGSKYEGHWAFIPPKKPSLPKVKNNNWIRNPIDRFVLAQLEMLGLQPSPEANRRTLIRRLSFDLTGLPPTPQQVTAFINNESPRAYEQLVDQLLESPHYGERMAMVWLDAARYSDTDGFQIDQTRTNWPWRDWVVDAYNKNMPFDRFTIEQYAGDLLPKPSKESIVATCFHRNHMTNGEGGRDPEESRVDYVIDRVNTMGTVWLGLTLGCCQCHNHRFDPISQKEYYELTAFFNSINEDGRAGGGAKPFLQYVSPHVNPGLQDSQQWMTQKKREMEKVRKAAEREFPTWLAKQASRIRQNNRHSSWSNFQASSLQTTHGSKLTQEKNVFLVSGPNPRHDDYILEIRPSLDRITGMRLDVLPHSTHTANGLSLAKDGHIILTNLKVSVRTRGDKQMREVKVTSAVADYQAAQSGARSYGRVTGVLADDPRTGWSTLGSKPNQPRTAVFGFYEPLVLQPNETLVVELRHRSLRGQSNIRRFRLSFTDERGAVLKRVGPSPLEELARVAGKTEKLKTAEKNRLLEQFLADHAELTHAKKEFNQARGRYQTYQKAKNAVRVMVLQDRKQLRKTHLLERGVWNNKGELVQWAVPEVLSSWPKDAPKNRLGLAKWLVSRDNPLTARVAINRYWQMYFGAGLVRTPEDFGSQGEMPTHPDLLDWLAVEFMENRWNVKHIQKRIVTSATYRQSSNVSPALQKRDPENRLLARASRFRLPSWMIRDSALRISGVLNTRRGGPPVYPYQPDGVWAASTMGRFRYQHSVGSDLYRRSIYTFWRRSVAPTGLFDAAKRRVCQIRVTRTNTPLHALTLMNDTTYVEAARVLAQTVLTQNPKNSLSSNIITIFEKILSRKPSTRELKILTAQFEKAKGFYQTNTKQAKDLLRHGATKIPLSVNRSKLAAYTIVAMTAFNLDEAITRE
ncbi:MAG: PSD1 and planctomycete cytochrome C domain-containing protein [Gemmataceae bacterium]